MLDVGDVAPDFTLPIDGGGEITLSSMRGKKVVLYFYPKDDTSGCTKEACDFREKISEFTKAGAVVLGMSPDSVKKHDKFKAKYDLPFSLVADEEKTALEAFGVWVEKSMYGRKYMGVERSTFLIDADGSIQSVWRKVKVPGHVDAVLDALQA
ncbi:MAG: thioredoxin-dependent thiol peroxidase [Alphaproteobacteria bacterium]|jgi:peroxiredoxin Q/BCP|nr:thioredoxin-dependent thiol peroxidase [Alphaproteobacteria bacterium]